MSSRRLRTGATALALAVPAILAATPPAAGSGDGSIRAVDVSRESGVAARELTRGATVLDVDSDGRLDLLASRHYRGFFHLYRNEGDGRFADIHDRAFPDRLESRDRHGCAAADVDLDGRTDIYCTTGGKKGGTGPNPNELWMQQPDGTFLNRAGAMNATDRWGRGREAVFLNANGDEFPDLLVGNAFPRADGHSGANHLLLNRGGSRFGRDRSFGLDRVVGSNSLQVADVDLDGRDDVLACGPKGLRIYENVGYRRFRDSTRRIRADVPCRDAVLARLGHGPRPDLVRLTDDGLRAHFGRRHGFGRAFFHRRVVHGEEVAAGDVDGDGREDVYVVRRADFDHDARDVMMLTRRHRMEHMPIPQTRGGIGEEVTAIDYDGDGGAEFFVQNGRRKAAGPTRLIDFRLLR